MKTYITNHIDNASGVNSQFNIIKEILRSQKYKDGLTNKEITEMTGIRIRGVREVTQRLKNEGLKEKQCRCGRTPILFFPDI